MIKNTRFVRDKLKNVVLEKKVTAIENMLKVIKAEEYKLLTDYMYLDKDDLDIYMDVTGDGDYVLSIKAVTGHLIDIGKML